VLQIDASTADKPRGHHVPAGSGLKTSQIGRGIMIATGWDYFYA
jgi:hypothetical protein